jgi:UDP-N-acetylmuramate-alanine ligase
VAGKALTAFSIARGTEVDTNERLTSRVLNQLQTIYMLLHWNEENGSPEKTSTTAGTKGPVTTTTITAARLEAADKDPTAAEIAEDGRPPNPSR